MFEGYLTVILYSFCKFPKGISVKIINPFVFLDNIEKCISLTIKIDIIQKKKYKIIY